jgi:HD-GYP domain-containing protein (c-di-GMP phosphodiesterase class II)
MAIIRVKIKAQDLVLGMFVSGLDRPWSQTPFPLQGFHIKKPRDIETVKAYSTYVFIDVTKGRKPSPGTKIYSTQSDENEGEEIAVSKVPTYSLPTRRADLNKLTSVAPRPIEIRHGVYEKTVPLRLEAARAANIVRELKGNLTLVNKQLAKGKLVDVENLQHSVDEMVASVLRCPDAFSWLLRLRHKDQQSYDHSLRTAMLSAQFGRYAGMSKSDIGILAMAGLLKDVGKIKLPRSILLKDQEQRGPQETVQYHRFVSYGVEILRSLENLDPKVVTTVRYHCERLDGSGFPQGVAGAKIPLLARILGIATEYDAISSPRESRYPVAPSRAVSLIYNMRDKKFQEDLVVKFIQSIGLYPTGTMVELTSGDLGVVIEQHSESRLSPTVAVLNRSVGDKGLAEDCIFIDLKDEKLSRKILLESGRDNIMNVTKLAIARDLEPSAYDVDYDLISAAFLSAEQNRAGAESNRGLMATIRKLFN